MKFDVDEQSLSGLPVDKTCDNPAACKDKNILFPA